MDDDARMAAWDRLHDLLAGMRGWAVRRPQRNPTTGVWTAVAINLAVRGRGVPRPTIEATGATEAEAVGRLADAVEMG